MKKIYAVCTKGSNYYLEYANKSDAISEAKLCKNSKVLKILLDKNDDTHAVEVVYEKEMDVK